MKATSLKRVFAAYRPICIFAGITFAVQLSCMIAYASLEHSRFALTYDFETYYQAWFNVVTRHTLDPHVSYPVAGNLFPDLDEFLFPLTAVFGVVSRSAMVLLVYQAACLVVTETIGFCWVLEILENASSLNMRTRRLLAVLAVGAAVMLPWTYQALAFDYHHQPQAGVFVTATMWSFYGNRGRLGFLFLILTALTFVVSATYVFAIGVTLLVASRRTRLWGVASIVFGIAYFLALRSVFPHASPGIVANAYATIGATGTRLGAVGVAFDVVTHPLAVLTVLLSQAKNIYANSAPTLFLALVCPWTALPWFLAYVENTLAGVSFAVPCFQYSIVYGLQVPGMIWTLSKIFSWKPVLGSPRAQLALTALVALNAAAWAIVWIPSVPYNWIKTTAATAGVLSEVHAAIPYGNQTIVSQGACGRFGDKIEPMAFMGSLAEHPLLQPTISIVLMPFEGIEIADSETTLYAIQQLLEDPRARLERADSGVWWFTYKRGSLTSIPENPQAAACRIGDLPGRCISASVLPAGHQYVRHIGKRGTGYIEANAVPIGYLFRQAYWRRSNGRYRIEVEAESDRPLTVEISDATQGGRVLVRHAQAFPKRHKATFDIIVSSGAKDEVFSGRTIFQDSPHPPQAGHLLELAVVAPDGARAKVWQVGIASR